MELKNYQKAVMGNLSAYMNCLNNADSVHKAWSDYWLAQDINVGFGVLSIMIRYKEYRTYV